MAVFHQSLGPEKDLDCGFSPLEQVPKYPSLLRAVSGEHNPVVKLGVGLSVII
jgi:hypothetical protein